MTNTVPPGFGASQAPLRDVPVAIYTTDAGGHITFYNEAAAALWGMRPELGSRDWCGAWRLHWPDGRPMAYDDCALAVALREQRDVTGAEAVAERPDGVRVDVLAHVHLIRDGVGTVATAVATLVDIGRHKRVEAENQRLASIVDSSDDAIVGTDMIGTILSWNRGAAALFGYMPDEMLGRSSLLLIPAARRDEERSLMARIAQGERVKSYDTVRRRRDGADVDVSITVSPIIDSHGAVIGASTIARDITDRKRAETQQELLMREMSHRVKNLFAVAASVVSLSARTARTPEEMGVAVRQRLLALTRAQELTRPGLLGSPQAPQSAELAQLVRTILSPYVDHTVPQEQHGAQIDGPSVRVGEDMVTSLALVLHEFATNAAKYGALSVMGGHVGVRWRFVGGNLRFEWRELGGPTVQGSPTHEGFGAVLAARTVKLVLSGTLTHHWRPEGLCIELELPAARLGLQLQDDA